ncbi:MAG TPA: UDP-2,3-diacylglucosamine diphosphatase [Usitatibacter sp.]|nr:UDP-2,3-diacylglucosamine diphosphatase [Usitatibacter sp.]
MRRLKRTLFVSDLHLDPARPEATARFHRFLDRALPGADALYILGDLFEYWVGDDGLTLDFPKSVATDLSRASRLAPLFFMHGNRDFLAAQGFASATGATLLEDPTRIDLYGRPTVLLHGDTLCTDDAAYQRFRAQVHDPAWQRAALAKPLAERVAMAEQLRSQSEEAKGGKDLQIMDVAPAAVERAFEDCDCDLMIHGHTHRPGRHVHRVAGRDRERWVLPDWYGRGGYLEASAAGLRAVEAA